MIGLCGVLARVRALRDSQGGTSAVEFALVATPFMFTLLGILQLGIYYMAQSSLDSGVNAYADSLTSTFLSQGTPSTPSAAALEAQIAAKSGGMISAATLLADLQPLSALTLGAVAVGSTAPNLGSPGTVLALRAQAPVVSFAPYFGGSLIVRSAVVLRRQGN